MSQPSSSSNTSNTTIPTTPVTNRLRNDFFSATIASFSLSPFVCSIDKCIISNASGRQLLSPCLKENFSMAFFKPHRFIMLREFHLIFGVYWATYMFANWADTLSRHQFNVSPVMPVFFTTTAVNMTTCILKDQEFTKMFANIAKDAKPKTRLPPLTYGLFAIRDSLTIFASFSLVPIVGNMLNNNITSISNERTTQIAQLGCPIGIQLLSTPLHLFALDLYNNPSNMVKDRLKFIRKEYVKTFSARACRILPAFGLGGVGNTWLRKQFGEKIGV